MTDNLIDFPTPNNDAELEAKAAAISQRIAEKLAIEKDMHTVQQAMMLHYIAETKLMRGDIPLTQRARIARQLAKLDAALWQLGEALESVREEAKAADARTAPRTYEESLALFEIKPEDA
jgi:hypothetical protein